MRFVVQQTDVEDRWRPLKAKEARIVERVLEDAADILETAAESRGIVLASTERAERTYKRIVSTMVIRVLKNPDGLLTETIDDYTYRRDSAVSAGALYVSGEELDQLRTPRRRRRRGAFSIKLG